MEEIGAALLQSQSVAATETSLNHYALLRTDQPIKVSGCIQ